MSSIRLASTDISMHVVVNPLQAPCVIGIDIFHGTSAHTNTIRQAMLTCTMVTHRQPRVGFGKESNECRVTLDPATFYIAIAT